MIRAMIYSVFMALPMKERMRIATWRFSKVREEFYRETRLDVAKKGLRNTDTLLSRLRTFEERHRKRKALFWPVYQSVAERMVGGDTFALAMKPFIPLDEFALLELAGSSKKEDAAVRGLQLAELSANAKRVLSSSTSVEVAYPAFLLVYLYGLAMLFGGAVFPQVAEMKPVESWSPLGQFLYAIDTACYEFWPVSLCVVTGAILGYFSTLKRWTGSTRNRVDGLPLMWRNRRDLRAALLIVSFSGLFDSGLNLRASIDRLKRNADPWMQWHLNRMGRRLTEVPDMPMHALDTGIFSEMVIDKITDAAGRDQFVEAIKDLGRTSLSRVIDTIRRNARITHYVLMGVAAGLFLVVGIGSYALTGVSGFDVSTVSTVTR